MYILSVLSGSSAHRCKCQRQLQKMESLAETFANNKNLFSFWFIWCCISCVGSTDVEGIFSLCSVSGSQEYDVYCPLLAIHYHPAIQMAFTVEKRR